jgi:hypothetical protein
LMHERLGVSRSMGVGSDGVTRDQFRLDYPETLLMREMGIAEADLFHAPMAAASADNLRLLDR